MKCNYCGKPYRELKENEIPNFFPESIKALMKWVPECDCLEKLKAKEMEEAEKRRQAECKANRVKKFKDISVIDTKFLQSTFEKAETTPAIRMAKKFTRAFLDGKRFGLFLYGKVGTGKTYASACIANELMSNDKTVMSINLGLYLNKVSREWGEAEKDVLEKVQQCDLLIVDDMGVEQVPDWLKDKVFNLIDARYRSGKSLIITTNLQLDNKNLSDKQIESKLSIQSRFGSRVADRVKEMCYQYEVIGESKRQFNFEEFKKVMNEY